MRQARLIAVVAVAALGSVDLAASGPLGIYGIIEKVVFEPNEQSPEQVQVWGVFAYVDGAGSAGGATSAPRRGYLYLALPSRVSSSPAQVETIRREWADLKAVAGTGDAVGFGQWGYIGGFGGLSPDAANTNPPYILERAPWGGERTDLRVRTATEAPANPAAYETNTGVVKLTAAGSHAAVVKQLKDTLRR